MKLFALALGLALGVLPATEVWAQFTATTWAKNCGFTTQPDFGAAQTAGIPSDTGTNLKNIDTACFDFDSNVDGAAVHSPVFEVTGTSAQVCLNPDMGADPGAVGAIEPHRCTGTRPTTVATQDAECIGLGVLDGTAGDATVQDACVRVMPGVYYIEATTCAVGAFCRVFVQAEGPLN